MWQFDIKCNVSYDSINQPTTNHTRLGKKTIRATNSVHDQSDRSAILKTQENTQIIEELTNSVPRHVNIVELLNWAPPPRSAPVLTVALFHAVIIARGTQNTLMNI